MFETEIREFLKEQIAAFELDLKSNQEKKKGLKWYQFISIILIYNEIRFWQDSIRQYRKWLDLLNQKKFNQLAKIFGSEGDGYWRLYREVAGYKGDTSEAHRLLELSNLFEKFSGYLYQYS